MLLALLTMTALNAVDLPVGTEPAPVSFRHFPTRLHAYVWMNWPLVPTERLAKTIGATPDQIADLGKRMGLPTATAISEDQWRRSYITIIRRNWHLLPYDQLLQLLDWTPEKLAFTLREDDYLFVKLGSLKPKCPPLHFEEASPEVRTREAEISKVVSEFFPKGLGNTGEPLFGFVKELSSPPSQKTNESESRFTPRFCSSYFALHGDPFLEPDLDGCPENYLERLAQAGVNGIWMQSVLYKMTPFPWDASQSEHWQERLENLGKLVARAKRHGIGVYLYFNEPRAMPLAFFEKHPELKGVTEGDHATLCTSVPAVEEYLRNGVATICKAVPDLAGFFTITGSENLTNCWSHYQGANCSHCAKAGPAAAVAHVNQLVQEGIAQAKAKTSLIAWDWGWLDNWASQAIEQLPKEASFMSVSEWSIPIDRGGVKTTVGEYSLSVIGPGPRATRHWEVARKRGLKTIAKVQAGNTWELAAIPYLPVMENVARHADGIRKAGVDGIMLGWSLGGYPSPNLAVYAEMGRPDAGTVDEVMTRVATQRYGAKAAPVVVEAWRTFSKAFQEFPYNGSVVYNAPSQMGPANPLWEKSTGYGATMVGIPYDALNDWRGPFPADVFQAQFTKMADGFDTALASLRNLKNEASGTPEQAANLARDTDLAEACAIHFRSVANQVKFVMARDALVPSNDAAKTKELCATLETVLKSEIDLATRLYAIQQRNSCVGFEATNHYFYIPIDLAAKVINCNDLLLRWLPTIQTSPNK